MSPLATLRHVRAPCWAGEGGPPTSAAGAARDAQLSFGTHLRRLRLRAGFSQETLAERAGVSGTTIGALEDGHRRRAYPSTLGALADALSLTSSDRTALLELSTGPALGPDALGPKPQPGYEAGLVPLGLPVPPTALIDREAEVAQVSALLDPTRTAVRLLTLVGPGGVGKTRLGLAVAAGLADAYPDGVTWVDLAPLSDERLVAATIAQALGVREAGGRRARELLLEHLRARRRLLVLDNVEHLPGAAPLLAELLAGCPRLALLVTSRAALRLRGEQRFPVAPLPAPADEPAAVEVIAAAPAVRLFVERARAVVPEFALDAANAPAVAAICRRLDGLPLAIELAAARTRVLRPQAMLARLGRRLPLLTGGQRDLPARQRTLRAAIGWSYDLLDEVEQSMFRRLAVFVGGCTLDAAESVCRWPEKDGEADTRAEGSSFYASPASSRRPVDVLDRLVPLVDNSLLRQDQREDPEARFVLLETIREFALERLEASGEADALRRRHAEYYLALAEEAAPQIYGREQILWLDRLEADQDNIRAALAWWQSEASDAGAALRLATALYRFWHVRASLSEGREWLGRVLARDPERAVPDTADFTQLRARALNGAAVLARAQGSYAAAGSLFEESLALVRELGDEWGTANALHNLGSVALYQGDYGRATALLEDSLARWRELADPWGAATALHFLAQAAHYEGDHQRADALGEESLALFRGIGDVRGIAMALRNLASVAYARGNDKRAAVLYEECLPLYRDLRDGWSIGLARHGMADVARRRGDHDRAAALYRESLVLRQERGDRRGVAECLEGLASLAAAQDRPMQAAHLFGAADALRVAIGAPLPPRDRAPHEQYMELVRTMLGEAAFAVALAAGRAMSLEQAIADALLTPAPALAAKR
jgi:predicted ATPase/transcriptional regulator with XRE-family HTH domain